MPVRSISSEQYFRELSLTSHKYFLPYVRQFIPLTHGTRVLELGCGEGGNLLPFAQEGCEVTGIDIWAPKIEEARNCFNAAGAKGVFIAEDVYNLTDFTQKYDVILCHDVIEHLPRKVEFLGIIKNFLAEGGVVFMSFPAWMMPFGGHQQLCRSRVLCHWPWMHLLPRSLYRAIMEKAGESTGCINELLDIKETRTPIELFEKSVHKAGLTIKDRKLWFINPHYEIKFHLKPRKVFPPLAKIPWLRNFYTTSCFYILK